MSKIARESKEYLKKEETEKDLALVKRELLKEQAFLNNKYEFEFMDKLNARDYTPEVAIALKLFLDKINEHYVLRENRKRAEKEKVVHQMIEKMGNDNFINLQEDYENESLSQLVRNANDISGEACLEKDGRLIQRIDPVYADPTESNFGGAHFYAPNKRFLGGFFPTFWFNISVIWIMSLILMVTLYFDVFKKILDLFGNFSYKKKHRIR